MPDVNIYLSACIKRMKRRVDVLAGTFYLRRRQVFQWGGLKLKLIAAITLVVLLSVITLNHYLTDLMEQTITEKAFEAGNMAIGRVADASFNAIVERTYENRVNLAEMVREAREDEVSNLLDISIYALELHNSDYVFSYVTGFEDKKGPLSDPGLIRWLLDSNRKDTRRETAVFQGADGGREAYRFTRPVIFKAGSSNHVVGAVVLYYDREAVTGPVRKAWNISTLATLLILLPATALAWWLSRRLSRPILQVTDAARKVADNDLDIRLDIRTADEIEFLADEFNRMVKGLREHQRMQKFVSGPTMNLIRNEAANMALGGSKRVQTFLFSDIRGFTAMSEKRKPDEVVEVINFYLNLQAQIIRRHGGDIDKFIGDEIMSTFEGDDALLRAIQAGVDIQQMIAAGNKERLLHGQITVNVGIGINRGEVVVGNMGSADHMDFTSVGAPVNLAARLCSHAREGEILLPGVLYETAGADFGAVPAEAISMKGISAPVGVVSLYFP